MAHPKNPEDVLRESEEKYRLLAETARDIILTHDMAGRITYVNQAGLDMTGYTAEEALGMPITNFIPKEHLAALQQRASRRAAGNTARYLYEVEFIGPTGQRIPVEVSSSPIKKAGQITGVLIVARDITRRKQAEKELNQYRTHLEELVRERTAELRKLVNLMAGREVRMAELKEIIRKLRRQLEEAGLTPVADDPLAGESKTKK